MEAALLAARGVIRPDGTAPLAQVLAAAARQGVQSDIAARAIENWTAVDVWKPNAALLALG
eukprot:2161144-Lingulodinium_polyedra.AAC.1